MKELICRSCGSNDIIRDGDLYVCQNCRTKYITEGNERTAAGNTVTADLSAVVESSMKNAFRAKGNEDWEEAERYYNKVEELCPDNAEAVFYSAYSRAGKELKYGSAAGKRDALSALRKDIVYISKSFALTDLDSQITLLCRMSKDIRILCKKVSGDADTAPLPLNIQKAFFNLLHSFTETAAKEYDKRDLIRLYSIEATHLEDISEYDITPDEKAAILVELVKIHDNWHNADPKHEIYKPESFVMPKSEHPVTKTGEKSVWDEDISFPLSPKHTLFVIAVILVIIGVLFCMMVMPFWLAVVIALMVMVCGIAGINNK